MKIFYSMVILLLTASLPMSAQSTFSFNCAKDTTITNCAISCITLKTLIPDVRSSSSTYMINPMNTGGCFRTYVDPGAPGTSTNLTIDDTYSSLINLPFTFPFFGLNYTSLVASTNGYLSFDASLALDDSHWPIGANLPSTSYDRALIMGPYHDLNPAYTTSPTRRIKYDVTGTAPNRRWVLSFFKVPLYSVACQNLIENTHQIILYEGIGVVEVLIRSKQQCPSWNTGRAIVGMQNYARNAAIMAPNRTATSPPWGTVNMNESWRFVPASGPTLYRRVQLFDLAGNLVSTGDTTSVGNGQFEVTFPNVCPSGTTTYIVRSEYESFNNAAVRVVGTDTIRVLRNNVIGAASVVNNITCNGLSTGSIILNPVGGVLPYQFSINGGTTYQSSNTFNNLSAGTYNIKIRDNSQCVKDTVIIVTQPAALDAVINNTPATCTVQGNLSVNTTGGVAPYNYSINGTTFQTSNQFTLNSGVYTVTVRDANGCTKTFNRDVLLNNDLTLSVRSDTTICAGGSVRLSTTSSATSYSWSPATGLDNPNIANPIASPVTPTTYLLTATLGQCIKTASVSINVIQQVSVSAGNDVTIVTGEKAQLNASATNAASYLWTPAAGLSSTTILNPVVQPAATTMYRLTVRNDNGCTAFDDILVTVVPYCIKVKNAFSPNGDGINDLWQVYDQFDCLKNISLGVFNRYGNKVFDSQNYRNNWDGTYKGKPVPDGTYYAVLNLTLISGKTVIIKSDLTIIR